MIDSILDRAASILERRFLTNAFLPVVLLAPAMLLPSLIWTDRSDRLVAGWSQASLGTQAFLVVGYFTLSWFFAVILASQWRNVVRLFEGYPLWRWASLDKAGKEWHRAISIQLGEPESREYWYLEYGRRPVLQAHVRPDGTQPTRRTVQRRRFPGGRPVRPAPGRSARP